MLMMTVADDDTQLSEDISDDEIATAMPQDAQNLAEQIYYQIMQLDYESDMSEADDSDAEDMDWDAELTMVGDEPDNIETTAAVNGVSTITTSYPGALSRR